MNAITAAAEHVAGTSQSFSPGSSGAAQGIFTAATLLLPMLARGEAIDARSLRGAMEAGFGASDADGAWV